MAAGKRKASGKPIPETKTVQAKKLKTTLTVEDAKAYFDEHNIKVHIPEGKDIDITPLAGFHFQGFAKRLIRYCQNKYENPTPIQACTWPLIMQKSDVCGIAKTGSGKTLAFALPYLSMSRLGELDVFEQPCALPRFVALAPTRELAMQIAEVCTDLVKALTAGEEGLYPVQCIYGGVPKRDQRQAISQTGIDMAICTPGRLQDLVEEETVDLSSVQYLVLDEADRMLEQGFADDVAKISNQVRPDRQVLFFSATWSAEVQKLAGGLCHPSSRPVRICVGQEQGSINAARHAREGIVQQVVVVDFPEDYEKQQAEKRKLLDGHLQDVLWASQENKVLVFVSQKQYADELANKLWEGGFKAAAMHGGKNQESRLWTLDQFRKGEFRLLVATDVIGRGIDIPSVSHVVVFDMGTIDDYVHRIGRTARGLYGKGHALVFFEYWHKEPGIAADLVQLLDASGQIVPEDLKRIASEVERGQRQVFKPWQGRKWNEGYRQEKQDWQSDDWAKRTRHLA
mmetsp:Transcript_24564/g.58292  ORF Transcript_24564/g.58292 Transcript_24564/m.58292 type:complete len:512 (-) Transcript_24564:69-1604(-)